jgi:D-3-phosphoglycerate dehydrogenase
MPRLLIAGQIYPAGMAVLDAEEGLEYEVIADPAADLTSDQLTNADALLIRSGVLTEELATRMDKLRIVSRHGVGCDNLPVEFLASRGVPVTIFGPVNAVSVPSRSWRC